MNKLVALHHTASSFLHDASQTAIGFENAFRNVTREPLFMGYNRFRKTALGTVGTRSQSLVPQYNPLSQDYAAAASRHPAHTYWSVFKRHDKLWTDSKPAPITEKERAVRETLFGTWERGGLGMRNSLPGVVGVKEYLDAKGVSTTKFAKEWEQRHQIDPENVKKIEGS